MPDDWLDGTCNAGMGSDSMKVDTQTELDINITTLQTTTKPNDFSWLLLK